MYKKKYLVATDLSEASDKALECAAELARQFDSEIILLHIFEIADVDESSKKMLASNFLNREIKRQLQEKVEEVTAAKGVNATYLTKEGALFSAMAEAAKETESDLLFIGTHGVHGVQHITGSFIAKTIHVNSIPVWIVQKETVLNPYQNIFVYIDEYPEVALDEATLALAAKFSAEIHFIFTEPAHVFTVTDTIKKTSAILDKEGIRYSFTNISDALDKEKELVERAAQKPASLIVLNRNNRTIDHQVSVLTNKYHIEVLCLNSIK